MIRERLLHLRERRAHLVARAAQQRTAMVTMVARAEAATAWIERTRDVARRLRAHPLWIAAGVALLVALRPRRVLGLLATAATLWRTWRNLRGTLDRFGLRQPRARNAY